MSRELMYTKKMEKMPSGTLKVLIDPMDDYTYTKIETHINKFIKVPEERFETIKVRTENGYKSMRMIGRMHDIASKQMDSDISDRPLTWTDLIYLAAVDVTKDKHVSVTRYPVNDYFGMFNSKVAVMSTKKTKSQVIEGIEYKHYPVIDPTISKEEVSNRFVDTLVLYTSYLSAMDADFDGDQLSIRGIYTQEANKEAEEQMKNPNNILNIMGENVRVVEEEGLQTIYQLTKD